MFYTCAFGAQDLILELYPKDSLVGWKVGATNQKALTALGLSEPLRGPLLSDYVHYHEADIPILQWSEMGASLLAAEVNLHSLTHCIVMTTIVYIAMMQGTPAGVHFPVADSIR
jgi:hypothetical protein